MPIVTKHNQPILSVSRCGLLFTPPLNIVTFLKKLTTNTNELTQKLQP